MSDPCIYMSAAGGEVFYIGVYVDDMVLAGSNDARIEEVKRELAAKFIKDLGKLSYFLGISIFQNQ